MRCNEDCDPCCGVEEWRHEFVCRACQRPRGMGSAIIRAASLVPNRPGCEQVDRTETHALSRPRSAILVSEYFVFLSRLATLSKEEGTSSRSSQASPVGQTSKQISTLTGMLSMRAPWAPRPHFDGYFFSVFNNLGELKLTLASKHAFLVQLGDISWNFALPRQN